MLSVNTLAIEGSARLLYLRPLRIIRGCAVYNFVLPVENEGMLCIFDEVRFSLNGLSSLYQGYNFSINVATFQHFSCYLE
jgi:hypothetical protein